MRCRRLVYVWALVMLLTLSPAYAAAKPGTSWAQAELETVVAAGIMAKAAAARPNSPLTRGELETIVAGLTHTPAAVPASPTAKVTIAALDARLVAALGLTDSAKLFTQGAKTCRSQSSLPLRDRNRCPPARSPHEPPGRARRARALAGPAGQPRRGRLLRSTNPEARRAGRAGRTGARSILCSARTDCLAEEGADDGGALHRLPVCVERRERVHAVRAVAVRAAGTRRLRLLGIRLARLQAGAVRRRRHTRRTCSRAARRMR